MENTSAEFRKAWTLAKSKEIATWMETKFGINGFAENLEIRISDSPKRRCSWGGIRRGNPYISLSIKSAQSGIFREYTQIGFHPIIGDIIGDWKTYVTALVCHELAHAVDWLYCRSSNFLKDDNKAIGQNIKNKVMPHSSTYHLNGNRQWKGHELFWQSLYAILRVQFVNNGVTNVHVADTKPKATRKPANRTIEVDRRRNQRGMVISVYKVNGKRIAYGYVRDLGWGRRDFVIADGSDINNRLTIIQNGKGARRWIKENILNK